MQSSIRLSYLKAMGIQQWVLRHQAADKGVEVLDNNNNHRQVEHSLQEPVSKPQQPIEKTDRRIENTISGDKKTHVLEANQQHWLLNTQLPSWQRASVGVLCRHESGQPASSFVHKNQPSKTLAGLLTGLKYFLQRDLTENSEQTNNNISMAYSQLALRGLTDSALSLEQALSNADLKVLLLMGAATANQLFNEEKSLSHWQNRVWKFQDKIPCIVTYHPFELYQSPLLKKFVMQDFELLRSVYVN